MMVMELKPGRGGVVIGGNIVRVCAMDLECTGSTLEMCMRGNGQMGRAMDVDCINVMMGAVIWGSSNGESSMALGTIISGTGIPTLESILQTRCRDLGFIILLMDIYTRGPGMKGEDRVLACTHSGTARLRQATGKMVPLMS